MKKHHSAAGRRAFAHAAGIIVSALLSAPTGADAAMDPGPDRRARDIHAVPPGGIAVKRTGGDGGADIVFGMNADKISNPGGIMPGMVPKVPRRGRPPGGRGCGTGGPAFGAWRAAAGDPLVAVLSDWGGRAGCEVIVEHNSDWTFGVDFSAEGDFRAVVDEVVAGFSSSAVPPFVVFYNNGVMTIGVR